jgi:hypothetical protein
MLLQESGNPGRFLIAEPVHRQAIKKLFRIVRRAFNILVD